MIGTNPSTSRITEKIAPIRIMIQPLPRIGYERASENIISERDSASSGACMGDKGRILCGSWFDESRVAHFCEAPSPQPLPGIRLSITPAVEIVAAVDATPSVSYTHLTLPTSDLV